MSILDVFYFGRVLSRRNLETRNFIVLFFKLSLAMIRIEFFSFVWKKSVCLIEEI